MQKYKDALHAIPADLHGGSTTSLCPAGQFQLLTGGYYSASYLQGLILEQWHEYCENVGNDRKKKRLIVTFNADLIDGEHHGTHEIITKNLKTQRDIASELIDEFLTEVDFNKKNGDSLRFTMGKSLTQNHGFQKGQIQKPVTYGQKSD